MRSRSCISCARGKARCDNKWPGCSRCTDKAIQCQYPASTPKITGVINQNSGNGSIRQKKTMPSLSACSPSDGNSQGASKNGDLIIDSVPILSDPAFADIGDACFNWDGPIDLATAVSPLSNIGPDQYPSLIQSTSIHHWIPPTSQPHHLPQAISSPPVSILRQPTATFQSLIRRPELSTGTQRTGNLIFHTLKSYPLMMLHHSSLPPFIHPHFTSSEDANRNMERLTNCICLVHMISSGIQGSRKLFWKNVRMECEQMFEEV